MKTVYLSLKVYILAIGLHLVWILCILYSFVTGFIFPNYENSKLNSTGELRRFKCAYCPYSSNVSTNMKNHSLRHTGEKKYSCSFCGARFLLRHHLKRHQIVHFNIKLCWRIDSSFQWLFSHIVSAIHQNDMNKVIFASVFPMYT